MSWSIGDIKVEKTVRKGKEHENKKQQVTDM